MIPRFRPLLTALALASLPSLAPAQHPETGYVDRETGVALTPPEKWSWIPAPKESAWDDKEAALKLVAKWEAPLPDADDHAVGLELIEIRRAPTLESAVAAWLAERSKDGAEFKVCRNVEFATAAGKARFVHGEREGRHADVAGIFSDGKRSWALVFSCSARRAGNRIGDWTKVLRTFRCFQPDAASPLAASRRTLPAGWQLHRTASYDIEYSCDREFATEIGVQLEAILLEYQRVFPLETFGRDALTEHAAAPKATGPVPRLNRMTVKLFKDRTTFESYAAANGVRDAAAYFSPAQNELCGYKTVDAGKKRAIHIMYHEAMHQYLHALFGGGVDIPTWLDEGMAEYFYGAEFQERTRTFAIGINKERFETIRLACKQGKHVPLARLFRMSQAEYYADSSLCYAEGWSLAWFLWRTSDPKYRGVIANFMKELRRTKSGEKAFEETFGKLDLEQLEKDWVEFVSRKM